MSLYYDAATVLTATEQKGSLKSLVYARDATFRAKPAHIYALISETAKYDTFLKEVIQNAGILVSEPKLTPILAVLLCHDHFFAKSGIAAATTHPLRQSIEKHKARLQSEFTRARLRRRAANIEQLKANLISEKGKNGRVAPRWARVNTLKGTTEQIIRESFATYDKVGSLQQLLETSVTQNVLHIDQNIPGLVAFHPDKELIKTQAYTSGHIILQDKASCFPAHLLLGNADPGDTTDVMDGCAAPGNKTTHAAAIVAGRALTGNVYACERDAARSKTLQLMVDKAGASKLVTVLQKQDFLALKPEDKRFSHVTHLLLDPSCSGSGILRREDIPKLDLPEDPRQSKTLQTANQPVGSKKRKRGQKPTENKAQASKAETSDVVDVEIDIDVESEAQPLLVDTSRLQKLSSLQSLIIEHAFRFPAARRVTYSTCSIHTQENEEVVHRVLRSKIAQSRGWRVLRRDEQVAGLRSWPHRGVKATLADSSSLTDRASQRSELTADEVEACIRCYPHDEYGTMGFFVCGFVRDGEGDGDGNGFGGDKEMRTAAPRIGVEDDEQGQKEQEKEEEEEDEEQEWSGFSDRSD